MNRYESRVLIRETHLDFFGHVNNATYLEIFEEVRWDFVTANGYGFEQIIQYKKGPVILDCRLRFLREIRAREEIIVTIEAVPSEPGDSPKIFKMRQQMINQRGEVACDALFTWGLFDTEQRKLVVPTPEWLRAIQL